MSQRARASYPTFDIRRSTFNVQPGRERALRLRPQASAPAPALALAVVQSDALGEGALSNLVRRLRDDLLTRCLFRAQRRTHHPPADWRPYTGTHTLPGPLRPSSRPEDIDIDSNISYVRMQRSPLELHAPRATFPISTCRRRRHLCTCRTDGCQGLGRPAGYRY